MIFWIGFTVMFLNEGFVMMRHVSPWFAKRRQKFIDKYGANVWYRFHGTLDYLWMGLVTIGLIVNTPRLLPELSITCTSDEVILWFILGPLGLFFL